MDNVQKYVGFYIVQCLSLSNQLVSTDLFTDYIMPNIENKKFFLELIFFTIGIIGILLIFFTLWIVFKFIAKFLRLLKKIFIIIKSIIQNIVLQIKINYVLNSESISSKLAYIISFLIIGGFILFYISIFIKNMNVLFFILKNELQYIDWFELLGYQYMEYNTTEECKLIKGSTNVNLHKPMLVSSPEFGSWGTDSASDSSEESDSSSNSVKGAPEPYRNRVRHPGQHDTFVTNPPENGEPAWTYDVTYQSFFTRIPKMRYPMLPDSCDLAYMTVKEYRWYLYERFVHHMERWIDEHYNGTIPAWDYPKHNYQNCYECVPFEMSWEERQGGVVEAIIKERARWSNWYDYLFMVRWDGRDFYDIDNQTLVCKPKEWDRIRNVVMRSSVEHVDAVSRIDALANWEIETFNQGMALAYPHLDVTRLPSGRTILHDPRIVNRPVFIADDIHISKVQEAVRKLNGKNPFTDFPKH